MKNKIYILIIFLIFIIPKSVSASTIEDNIDLAKEKLKKIQQNNFLDAHPVGSIYITTASDENTAANVALKYGGTWEVYGAGRMIVGYGSNGTTNYSTINSIGGYSTSVLSSVNMIPSHYHKYNQVTAIGHTNINLEHVPTGSFSTVQYVTTNPGWSVGNGWGRHGNGYCATMRDQTGYGGYGQSHNHSVINTSTATGTSGNSSPFSVQNPYIVSYMYKRIS